MKQSILQFKKYHSFSLLFFPLLLLSCLDLQGNRDLQEWSEPVPLAVYGPNTSIPMGEIYIHKCHPELRATWDVPFLSPFRTHAIEVVLHPDPNQQKIKIDGQVVNHRPEFPKIIHQSLQGICTDKSTGLRKALVSDILVPFQNFVTSLAPHCQVQFDAHGWHCALPSLDSSQARLELEKLKKRMIYRWNRRPYNLARRVALTNQLAESFWHTDKTPHPICKIISHSIVDELPLVMQSPVWVRSFCDPSATKDKVLEVGLYLAMQELKLLVKKFERSSKIGYLTVRIPHSEGPPRTLWVSIKPQTLDDSIGISQEAKEGCWHPLLNPDQPQSFRNTAELLGITDSRPNCSSYMTMTETSTFTPPPEDLRKYVYNSISSETEFPISNGRTKILRLPKGQYTYELKRHTYPASYESDQPRFLSSGTIAWMNRRPRPLISGF